MPVYGILRKIRKLCGTTHQPYLMSLPIYEYISNTDLYEEVKKIVTIVHFYNIQHHHTTLLGARSERKFNKINKKTFIPQLLISYSYILQLNGSVRPVPPPRDHLRIEKDGRLVNRAPAPQVPDRKQNLQQQPNNLIAHVVEPTNEQLDSIRKYQVSFRL